MNDRVCLNQRNAHIVAQARGGLQPRDIARQMSVSRFVVYTTLRRARVEDPTVPRFTTGGTVRQRPNPFHCIQALIDQGDADALGAAASSRGLTVPELIYELIGRIA